MKKKRNAPIRLPLQYFAEDLTEDVADDDFDFSEEIEETQPPEEPPTEPLPPEVITPEQPPILPPMQPPDPHAREIEAITKIAASYGMSTEEYISAVEKQAHEAQIQAQLDNGIPREVAERLLNLENQSKAQQEKETAMQRQSAQRQQFADFVAKYPDVKELPQEVITSLDKGVPLVYAYAEYENKQLKSKLAAYEKNTANKQKSTGTMLGEAANEDTDDFLAGFNL